MYCEKEFMSSKESSPQQNFKIFIKKTKESNRSIKNLS